MTTATDFFKALDCLAASADPRIESLRWKVIREYSGLREVVTPLLVSQIGAGDVEWGHLAFHELRSQGFIEIVHAEFVWGNFTDQSMSLHLESISTLLTAALVRMKALKNTPVFDDLTYRQKELHRVSKGLDGLSIALAIQKIFLPIIAAVNSPVLLNEYINQTKLAFIYHWSDHFNETYSAHMIDIANKIVDAILNSEIDRAIVPAGEIWLCNTAIQDQQASIADG
ncbi:hypothetical protein D6851_15795 [Altericroceibacterium spongiae]|uniref:Uncharacterized protein n=1 Tax=Altericroceibacterium spongiae TaxID=2320269 RepID=A0A420EAN0_9SPHN|nr:hypothetical protein [Altericroceibacterium spongiae]RKF17720.1 hypothetical protein D6851_15795 [Altericroceibacterium spongiae]